MDQILIVILSILIFAFILTTLYFSSALKKQKGQIKIIDSRSVKFSNRDAVENIVNQMDKIKMLVSSASDLPEVSNNVSEILSRMKYLNSENEKRGMEVNLVDNKFGEFKEFIKAYEKNYQKLETDFKSQGLMVQQYQQKMENLLTTFGNNSHLNGVSNVSHITSPNSNSLHSFSSDYNSNSNNNNNNNHLAGSSNVGNNNNNNNISSYIKECPKPPIELKFAADVLSADNTLEISIDNVSNGKNNNLG
jgi:DNA repair exonuclease SbcCD ATPase subunit